jgi:hypothetical protein
MEVMALYGEVMGAVLPTGYDHADIIASYTSLELFYQLPQA